MFMRCISKSLLEADAVVARVTMIISTSSDEKRCRDVRIKFLKAWFER